MSIQTNLQSLREHIPTHVQLVCVSKFHSNEVIQEAYDAGERIFGENKVQELCTKFDTLPKDIQWHYIGHLQSNKVKYIVPFVTLIHGVDSFKLLHEIDKSAAKINKKVKCLLQVHIASEETKFGFSADELMEMLQSGSWKSLLNVNICGIMGMATFTDDKNQIRNEFRTLKMLFDKMKSTFFDQNPDFSELSMGMSDDFRIAIEEGSTMVRIGSAVFGVRNY
ncbi:MAG: YggS family pyridoxal phosphate-dependent enzyme [Paludibacter sp.]|nr:YggS family pyridoxal phosphate-dependent enzyme [Paludibacter sp.]